MKKHNQMNLFGGDDPEPIKEGLSRRTDPAPSHMAGAEVVENGTTGKHRNMILAVLSDIELTNAQIAKMIGLTDYQVTRRMTELERLGLAVRGGDTKCPWKGRMCGTWKRA